MPTITFTVPGIPAPQGSKSGFIRGDKVVIVEQSKNIGPWRNAVAIAARKIWQQPPTTRPVLVALTFTYARPASHFSASRKKPNTLLASAPDYKITQPDLDKLIRSTLDALTGIIYVDDRQINAIAATKEWSPTPDPNTTYCWISITY